MTRSKFLHKHKNTNTVSTNQDISTMAQGIEYIKTGVRMLEKEIDASIIREKSIGSKEESRSIKNKEE